MQLYRVHGVLDRFERRLDLEVQHAAGIAYKDCNVFSKRLYLHSKTYGVRDPFRLERVRKKADEEDEDDEDMYIGNVVGESPVAKELIKTKEKLKPDKAMNDQLRKEQRSRRYKGDDRATSQAARTVDKFCIDFGIDELERQKLEKLIKLKNKTDQSGAVIEEERQHIDNIQDGETEVLEMIALFRRYCPRKAGEPGHYRAWLSISDNHTKLLK